MGGSFCCEQKYFGKLSINNNSQSFFDYDIQSIMINKTCLSLVYYDFYKFIKKNKVGCIFNVQDSHLEFPDKMFKNNVGESVAKECRDFIKANEDLSLNKVMHTKGGNINCEYIIHGCYIKDSNADNDADNLRRLISDTLKYANNTLKSNSILFNLQQLKANCSKTCISVILACQNFINECSPVNLKTIFFVGSEENSLEMYSKALTNIQKMIEKEDAYFSDSSQQCGYRFNQKINSPSTNVKINRPERTSSKKSNQLQQSQLQQQQQQPVQNDPLAQNRQVSLLKSQIRNSYSSDLKELNNSQLNKSKTRIGKSKNNLEDNIYTNDEVQTQGDLDTSDHRVERANSHKLSISKLKQQQNSYGSGMLKDHVLDIQKSGKRKELSNYKNTIEQTFIDEEEQQLKKLKSKKNPKHRNMKTEFLLTNITQPREEDGTSEKNNSFGQFDNEDSFSSAIESDQITALINVQQHYQIEDSLLNTKLNLLQSHDYQQNFSNSNNISYKFISSHQNM